jgi:hypothetical protein
MFKRARPAATFEVDPEKPSFGPRYTRARGPPMTWLVFLNHLFRIVRVVGAVVLLLKGINHGWGWLIFAAIVTGITVETKGNKTKADS